MSKNGATLVCEPCAPVRSSRAGPTALRGGITVCERNCSLGREPIRSQESDHIADGPPCRRGAIYERLDLRHQHGRDRVYTRRGGHLPHRPGGASPGGLKRATQRQLRNASGRLLKPDPIDTAAPAATARTAGVDTERSSIPVWSGLHGKSQGDMRTIKSVGDHGVAASWTGKRCRQGDHIESISSFSSAHGWPWSVFG